MGHQSNRRYIGLSRQGIFSAVDASLSRLQTSYIDLLQIHRFDKTVPVEETMEALHDLVKSGKVRYIGASSMWAYQFAIMQFTAEKRGWTKFISMQNYYNLLYREEEREMNKFCNETGVGLIPVCHKPQFELVCSSPPLCCSENTQLTPFTIVGATLSGQTRSSSVKGRKHYPFLREETRRHRRGNRFSSTDSRKRQELEDEPCRISVD